MIDTTDDSIIVGARIRLTADQFCAANNAAHPTPIQETPTMPADPKPSDRPAVTPRKRGKASAPRITSPELDAAQAPTAAALLEEIPAPSPQGQAAILDAAQRATAPVEATDADAAILFSAGRTIAQIARQLKTSHEVVRLHLDTAGVDYSKDKNNGAVPPSASGSGSKAAKTAADKLDASIKKHAAGELSKQKQILQRVLSGPEGAEFGLRLSAIGALQQDDPDQFARACAALAGTLWGIYRSEG